MKNWIWFAVAALLFCTAPPAWSASLPSTINYQGFLSDEEGSPIDDGDYELTFRLYTGATGGDALWTETWTGANVVAVENGRFNLNLGAITPFDGAELDFRTPYFLEIQLGTDTPFSPRLAFAAVPYAMRAKYLEGQTRTVSADCTLTALDDVVLADTSATGVSITLPAAADFAGSRYTLTRVAGDNNLTVLPSGSDTINGGNSLELTQIGHSVQLVSDGSAWQAVAEVGGFLLTQDTSDIGSGVSISDLIVQGSECVGVDCRHGESFGFDTLILKENNTRILFNDTSSSASFPRNDWRLTANDSNNGGRSYFAIDDVTAGITGLVVEAGGKVGIGTPDTPRGKFEVMTYQDGTGSLGTSNENGTGTLSSSGTPGILVSGTGTAFTTELAVGAQITAGGETKTVTYIENDTGLYVDSAWSSSLTDDAFSFVGSTITGNGTAFTAQLQTGSYIVAGGSVGKVAAIGSDTALTLEAPFGAVLSNSAFKYHNTGLLLSESGDVGIGTATPDEKVDIEFGDTDVDVEIGRGTTDTDVTFLTLRSPNGTKFYLTVDDSGTLSASTTKP
jgi:hypothetical protein